MSGVTLTKTTEDAPLLTDSEESETFETDDIPDGKSFGLAVVGKKRYLYSINPFKRGGVEKEDSYYAVNLQKFIILVTIFILLVSIIVGIFKVVIPSYRHKAWYVRSFNYATFDIFG